VTESAITVELAVGDPELAERVRDALLESRGFAIVARDDGRSARVLVTDFADHATDAAPVLVLLADVSEAVDALRLGATAVLPADAGAQMLRAAVRAAALGLTILPAELRHGLVGRRDRHETDYGSDASDAPPGLTARELQVLQLLAEGASNKAIARRLGITPHTAKFHVAAIMGKLGASGRTDAVAKAMRLGLVMV
jgi:DNA-binding NarL/FixJ family response regulator